MDALAADRVLISLLTAASLCAVWIPLWRGFRLCVRARGATRTLRGRELQQGLKSAPRKGEPLALLMARVFARATRQGAESGQPVDFVLDASRQYVSTEYDSHYARVISMYANLLPPIGFIGTTTGMLVLFVSMHLEDAALELGALAVALLSSIFALLGFALLESLKIRLYRRLLRALDSVVELQQSARLSGGGAAAAPAAPAR